MTRKLLSSEFLEMIKSGQKEFDSIEIQYADLSGRSFSNIIIKNSKFLFTSFRHCNIENVTFENCEMFFVAMGFASIKDSRFINCKVDYSGFTWATFNNASFVSTKLSWISLIDANTSGLELKNCTEFRVVREISEITSAVIEKGISELQPIMQQLDFDSQQRIKQLIEPFVKRYNLQVKEVSKPSASAYKQEPSGASGYKMFDTMIDNAISAYGEKAAYKSKNAYETKSHYSK